MKKIFILASIIFIISFCACREVKHTDNKETICIGFSMATLNEDRWVSDRDFMRQKAEERGCDIIITNANGDPDEQYDDVAGLVDQGIDVLVYAPQDFSRASECVSYAKKRGVPVISYDRLAGDSDLDAYISFDSYKTGRIQAQELLKYATSGRFLIICGPETDRNSGFLYDGVADVLNEENTAAADVLTVKQWRKEEAYDMVLDRLSQKDNDIKAVIAANDSLAWGAVNAAAVLGLSGKIFVAGQDADLSACKRIEDNTQTLTIYKPVDELARRTVDICIKLACGMDFGYDKLIDNGKKEVPGILLDVYCVDASNVKDIIEKKKRNYESKYDLCS
ncbi:MAG: substrate-binding domain-containing protein [Oscillospiraceae bacterium]|nr:substrate-binding domain-containing protein [Oscillospiraceae bacterium]